MSYKKYYPGGWQSGETGGTPITPEALNHMEAGIVAAAPGGFGYGGKMTYYDMEDAKYNGKTFEDVLNEILSGMDNTSAKQIQIFDPDKIANKYIGTLWKYTPNYATLFAVTYSGSIVVKRKSGGTWYEWEYVNPPMEKGKEYRTAKRHDTKVVYTKLVDFGALPNKTTKSVAHGVSGTIVGFEGFALGDSGKQLFPFIDSSLGVVARMHLTSASVIVVSNADLSGYSSACQIWYTKD